MNINPQNLRSKRLQELTNQPCWYHGTSDPVFEGWKFPPPRLDPNDLSFQHNGIFLTSDREYASLAGNNLAVASIGEKAVILDTTINQQALNSLALLMQKDPVYRLTDNAQLINDPEFWLTGRALRPEFSFIGKEPGLNAFMAAFTNLLLSLGFNGEQALATREHNATRYLIEMLCHFARTLGYAGMYMFEIDRHTGDEDITRECLAVFQNGIVTPPHWVANELVTLPAEN